jgi:hypothetical protein
LSLPRFVPSFTIDPPATRSEIDRIARLDADRNAHDQMRGRGYDNESVTIGLGFHCIICRNNPNRCVWCANATDDPGVISCGFCTGEDRRRR